MTNQYGRWFTVQYMTFASHYTLALQDSWKEGKVYSFLCQKLSRNNWSYNLFCKWVPLKTPLFGSNTSLLKWNYLASILGLTSLLAFECLFTYSIWRKFWDFCYPSNFKKNFNKVLVYSEDKGEKWETIKNIYLTPYLIPVW